MFDGLHQGQCSGVSFPTFRTRGSSKNRQICLNALNVILDCTRGALKRCENQAGRLSYARDLDFRGPLHVVEIFTQFRWKD